jgi:cell division protein FtsI (penicillin-binding protein 3)
MTPMTDTDTTPAEQPEAAVSGEAAILSPEPTTLPCAAEGALPPVLLSESTQTAEQAVAVFDSPAIKPVATAPAEPWRRRALRALLYGSKVDRNAKARARVGLAILAFALVYVVIAVRLIAFGVASDSRSAHRVGGGDAIATARPDILDRNGEVLATDVRVPSLYAEPRRLIDVDEAVELLTADLPDIDAKELRERLSSKRGFVWLKRDVTPDQQRAIYRQGLPGIGFLNENKRDYPSANEASHILGHVNIDNQGIAGMEKWLDGHGLAALHMAGLATDRLQNPVELSVDLRVQHALRDELVAARTKFKALATAGIVLDVRTGEVIAMVSEPDYNPNNPHEALDPTRINRLTTGVFEMGSTFKAFTIAMALDSGKVTLKSSFDARMPLRFGKFDIHDFHAQNRVLTVPEIFTYSSNIGAARAALAVGIEQHKAFLKKLGQLDRLRTELPESAEPIVPKRWGELNTITISFGHGLSVAPLQAVMGVAALMNGGILIPPTFLKRSEAEAATLGKRVIKPETSEMMRYLMRLNVEKGTAEKAEVKGYYIGGKTGTADKVVNGHYSKTKVLTDFMAVLPADKPRYVLLIMIDDPQILPETHGFNTSGWNAVPVGGAVVARIAPLLGIEPRMDLPTADRLILASIKESR